MAAVVNRSRPSVAPHIRQDGEPEKPNEAAERARKGANDLIKDRSPLADMLYLRCRFNRGFVCADSYRAGRDQAKVAWILDIRQCGHVSEGGS